ncbi:MAG TPA: D-glycero-beta-D-manno-heptose-7-phosphate kinase [Thermodesulfobacteriota bacterium]|nr:D-glycero-beta-D-manno-heptose-7-phosphate kinase [Thermodesulfobacteriota bacterium]
MVLPPSDIQSMVNAIRSFSNFKVLVVGDIMMDEFLWGDVTRISPEAPVPIVKVEKETFLLGGAANVVNNLLGLKGQVLLSGVIGADGMGRRFLKRLQGLGTATEGIVVEEGRPTAIKTRVIAHHQQVVRVDREKVSPVSAESTQKILQVVEKNIAHIKGIIVSDYGKGVVSQELMVRLKKIASGKSIPILVDPKPYNIKWYDRVTLITPNHLEAGLAAGKKIESQEDLLWVGTQLLKKTKCESVLITRGKEGMTLFSKNKVEHIPTVAQKVFDVTGAGDTVIATLILSLVSGLTLSQACLASNYAAGIVVGEVGTAAVQAGDLIRVLTESISKRV